MAKKSKKEGKDPTADGSGSPPLQTPVAGGVPGDSGAGVKGGSTLNLEDVPMSGRPSAGPTAGRLSTGAVSASGTASSIDTQKTKEIMGKVDRTKSIMEENIDAATQRGENLTELQQKTEAVAEQSKSFSKNARTVKKNLWWKNMKMTICIVIIVLIVLGAGITGIVLSTRK